MAGLFRAKTDEEIAETLKGMSVEELLTYGVKLEDKNIILYAIERADTKVWAYDYSERRIDELNPVNTKQYWELTNIDERYISLRRIFDGKEEDWTLKFFANRFTPIYPDSEILRETKETINKIYKSF